MMSVLVALAFRHLFRFSATISSLILVTGTNLSFLFRKYVLLDQGVAARAHLETLEIVRT